MTSRRLAILSALSLAACIAFAELWGMSYRDDRVLTWGDAGRLTVTRGAIVIQSPTRSRSATFIPRSPGWTMLGFTRVDNEMIEPNVFIPVAYYRRPGERSNQQTIDFYRDRNPPLILCGTAASKTGTKFVVLGSETGVPIWFLVVITLVLPVKWYVNLLRQRRLAHVGHCRVCDYDLRASTDRCPECGTPFTRPRRRQPMAELAQ